MRWILGVMVLVCLGCTYGPQHLAGFRLIRDIYDRHIEDIEARHGLPPTSLRAQNTELEQQVRILRAELDPLVRAERAEAAKKEAAWLATLTPEQRFQWTLKQEELHLQRESLSAQILDSQEERDLRGRMHRDEIDLRRADLRRKIWIGDHQTIDQGIKVEHRVTP